MRINSTSFIQPKIPFVSKLQSNKELAFDENTFKISMAFYEDNYYALQKMNQLALDISSLIKADIDFDTILHTIEEGVRKINYNMWTYGQIRHSKEPFPIVEYRRGEEYLETYLEIVKNGKHKPKSNSKYKHANTCEIYCKEYPNKHVEINCGWKKLAKSNLNYAKNEYNLLKKLNNPSLDDINRACATIQWLILQESPYYRGNDSIANILTKAIYHSYGIKVSPPKVGMSFDFEGFYRDLDEYIKIYPDIFETCPYKY